MKPHTAGAYLGFFAVLVVTLVGAIDKFAEMPRSVFGHTAQATMGAGCEKAAIVSPGSVVEIGVPLPTQQACIPTACWANADGGQTCMLKPAAQGMAGGGGGLMNSIGDMLKSLMQGKPPGGGGQPPPSGGGSGNIDYQFQKKPECKEFTSNKGTTPVNPGDDVVLTWIRTGGDTESITLTPAAFGAENITSSPITIKAPARSVTYTLTVSNRKGSSTCTARVYVGPSNTPDEAQTTQKPVTSTESRNSDIVVVSKEETILENPLGDIGYNDLIDEEAILAAKEKAAAEAKAAEDAKNNPPPAAEQKPGLLMGVLNSVSGLISRYGEKEQFQIDDTAFQEDPNAFVTEDFDVAVDALGADGIYSKEDIATLEKLSRQLDEERARRGEAPTYTSKLSQAELSQLWSQPGSKVSGGLGDNFLDSSASSTRNDNTIFGRFTSWVSDTFCFWCVSGTAQGGGAILTLATLTDSNSPSPVPEPTLKLPDGPPDVLTPACKDQNNKAKEKECSSKKDAEKTKCEQAYDTYENPKSIIPFESGNYIAGQELKDAAKENPESKCVEKEKANSKKCADTCKGSGYAGVPIQDPADKSKIGEKYKICDESMVSSNTRVLVCREKPTDEKAAREKAIEDCIKKGGTKEQCEKANPAPASPPASPPAGPSGGGNPDSGGGDKKGGEGGGMPKMDMPKAPEKKGGGEGGGQGSPTDPCGNAFAQYKPECNPLLPKDPPKCEDVGLGDPVIEQGKSTQLNFAITGKGTITTVVNYATRDKEGKIVKGTLGAVAGGSVDVSPDYSTTYTVKATNEIGSVTCKPVKLSVKPPEDGDTGEDLDVLDVTCDGKENAKINRGDEIEVTWEGCPSNTKSVLGTSTEDGTFSTGTFKGDGSVSVKPVRDATYVIRCRDEFNNSLARNSCSVEVNDSGTIASTDTSTKVERPVADIVVADDDGVVPYGSSVRVEWKSKYAVSCVVYGPGCNEFGRSSPKCFKEVGLRGYVVGNVYTTSTFTLECRGKDRKTLVTDEEVVSVDDGSSIYGDNEDDLLLDEMSDVETVPVSTSSPSSSSSTSDDIPTDQTLEELLGE